MDRRTKLMGNMAVGLMVVTGRLEMTCLEIAGRWMLHIGELMDTSIILFLVLTGIMITVVIILIRGVIGDNFHMN